jgi:hypothetical protein
MIMSTTSLRTTVSVSKATKARMDKWRATGQCYDGFLCELVNLWEKTHRYETASPSEKAVRLISCVKPLSEDRFHL